jgi:hypothetical protein
MESGSSTFILITHLFNLQITKLEFTLYEINFGCFHLVLFLDGVVEGFFCAGIGCDALFPTYIC